MCNERERENNPTSGSAKKVKFNSYYPSMSYTHYTTSKQTALPLPRAALTTLSSNQNKHRLTTDYKESWYISSIPRASRYKILKINFMHSTEW